MHKLKLKIQIENPDIIYQSIKPEIESAPSKKSSIKIKKKPNQIYLIIKSKTITSFRAAMNSWLRWIKVAEESNKIGKKD